MTRQTTSLPIVEAPTLAEAKGCRHAFFTREGGVSGGLYQSLNCGYGSDDDQGNVTENRQRICCTLDLPAAALVTSYQVHGTNVVSVKEPWSHEVAPKADGLVTKTPGVALGILTADCAPVLFTDRDAGVIGACHAGWRGALHGIIESTLTAMDRLGAKRSQISAAIGPCIAQNSYQVGPVFRDQFLAIDQGYDGYFDPDDDNRYRFDLPGFVLERLKDAGISDACWVGMDTCDEELPFFSYRRSTNNEESDFGRGLSVITLSES